jgi:hypothetical protein
LFSAALISMRGLSCSSVADGLDLGCSVMLGGRDGAHQRERRTTRSSVERHMPEDRPARHCRHCLGNCAGGCLLEDGQCIHGWNGKRPYEFTWQLLLTRRWWHRVLWGP